MVIAVTSAAGTAVQTTSRPVCPWIGAPSSVSSGAARNFHTAYRETPATRAKMTMQMIVTNQ